MKSRLEKEIIEEFKESYNIDIDKESLKQQYINSLDKSETIKEQFSKIKYWKKLCYSFGSIALVLLCGIIVLSSIKIWHKSKDDVEDIITEEFEAYMLQESEIYTNVYNQKINITKKSSIYIYFGADYNLNSENRIFFYIIKSTEETANLNIIINEEKRQISNNDYGIIAKIPSNQETYEISFIIENNGDKTEYIIRK